MADEWLVYMSSDVYGCEEFGPYDSAQEAGEGIKRLKDKVRELNDGIDREIWMELYDEGNYCSECDDGEDVQSTYCGSLCNDCLREHIKECEPCNRDFAEEFREEEEDA